MPPIVEGLAAVVILGGLVLFVADRLLLRMEARGWIYWRRTQPRGRGRTGNALLEVHALLEPDKRSILEARRAEEDSAEENQDAGDDPNPAAFSGP